MYRREYRLLYRNIRRKLGKTKTMNNIPKLDVEVKREMKFEEQGIYEKANL